MGHTRLTFRMPSPLHPTFHYCRESSCQSADPTWMYDVTETDGSPLTIAEALSAPSGAAPASPDLIFGTALTPQRSSSDAS